jgi:micrococcal nuclease
MKDKLKTILIISIAILWIFIEQTHTQTEETTEVKEIANYEVIKVVDGDTVSINIDAGKETLRLIGIDTPETVHPTKPVECFGIEASNKAKELLEDKIISIEHDSSQGKIDKYGRTLAYVILPDGRNFNEIMIKEGYAYEYTYNEKYKTKTIQKQRRRKKKKKKTAIIRMQSKC